MSFSADPGAKFLFSLDTPNAVPVNSAESYVRGWFVPEDGSAYELWLTIDETHIQAFTGLPRPDVYLHYERDPAFKDPGFLVRFTRPESPSSVRLIAVVNSEEILLADDIQIPAFGEHGLPTCETIGKYQQWLATSERRLFWPEDEVHCRVSSLPQRPLISVVLATPDAHLYLINRCLESVLQQHYPHWQLCIACGSSESSASRKYLETLASEDSRVQLAFREGATISELRNHGLDLARGDFVLRLDYRDELHPFALTEIVSCLNVGNAQESIDLVYADEDEMDFYGARIRPLFKPDFVPEAFRSLNFIGNIAAIRRGILMNAGGYGTEAEALDDWSILSRVLESTEASRVRHIRRVLYHVRRDDPAVAPLPRETDKGPLKKTPEHLAGRGVEGRTDWKIAVLIRPEDGAFQQAALVASVDSRTTRIYELLGGGAELLADTNPPGAERATSGTVRDLSQMHEDVFVFINRPLETLNHSFFDELAREAMRDDCGLVTGISLDWTGRILHSGLHRLDTDNMIDVFAGGHFSQSDLLRNIGFVRSVDSISDEFFAVKRDQLAAVGGLGAISSARMPDLVQRLVEKAPSSNSRVLVTPYAVATFDIPGVSGFEQACCDSSSGLQVNDGGNMTSELLSGDEIGDSVKAAEAERKLAAAELRLMASERNRLRRELAAMEQVIARQETTASAALRQNIQQLENQVQQLNREAENLKAQLQDLNTALESERRLRAEIQNSVSWKVTAPLRACMRIVKGRF